MTRLSDSLRPTIRRPINQAQVSFVLAAGVLTIGLIVAVDSANRASRFAAAAAASCHAAMNEGDLIDGKVQGRQ